jgi:hypothetical protein
MASGSGEFPKSLLTKGMAQFRTRIEGYADNSLEAPTEATLAAGRDT